MTEQIMKGTWVELQQVVLVAGKRAPQVPDDTQRVPLEMRVKGFLADAAALGEQAQIITPAGRRLTGILIEANPAYSHSFGRPIPELAGIGGEIRSLLLQRRGDR